MPIPILSYTAQDTANAFWDMLIPLSPTFKGNKNGRFTQRQLDLWKKFLSIKVPGRSITKDVWTLFLEFTSIVDPDFIDHDEDGECQSIRIAWFIVKINSLSSRMKDRESFGPCCQRVHSNLELWIRN